MPGGFDKLSLSGVESEILPTPPMARDIGNPLPNPPMARDIRSSLLTPPMARHVRNPLLTPPMARHVRNRLPTSLRLSLSKPPRHPRPRSRGYRA
jgi:hypothetical protein